MEDETVLDAMNAETAKLRCLHSALVSLLVLSFGLIDALPGIAANRDPAESAAIAVHGKHVSDLINQLGDPDYHLRRRAEVELLKLGRDVFDQLQQVEDHSDLEIATRATYILQKIDIRWVRPDDSEAVRILLQRYANLSADQRKERMEELAALEDRAGLAALCRIARFEPSLQLARYAALQILGLELEQQDAAKFAETVSRELGNSRRVPVQWISTYFQQLQDANPDMEKWLSFVDSDIELLAEDSPDTSKVLLLRLIYLNLEMVQEDIRAELIGDFMRRRIDLSLDNSAQLQPELYQAFAWMLRKGRLDVSEILEKQYAERIREDRMSVYYLAVIRWKQDREEDAQELADQAFRMEADDLRIRTAFGNQIGEYGRHDWAEREWEFAVEKLPVTQSADARRSLAAFCYHDRGQNKQAAKLMQELCDAYEADPKIKSQIMRNELLKLYFSQRDYLLACHAADEGDYKLQRQLLDSAYGYEELDADILIAMYRSPEAEESYRKETLERIETASSKLEKVIADNPDDAQSNNHWAWLISNTEGDYYKAIERSKRSLELSPENPSYLDTLGRCYYAAGKLEEAIEIQRKAVSMHPHLKVMKDQLKLFERELAARESP